MKKTTLALALALATLSAKSQKGSYYVGGNVGFNSTTSSTENASGEKVDGARFTSWSLSPEVGTFLTDHLQLGIGVTLQGTKLDARTNIENITRTSQTGATLYSRYFFGTGNFRPFVGVNVFVLPGKEKTTLGPLTTEEKLMSFGANLNAGFAYGLSSRVAVVGSFGALGFTQNVSEVKGSGIKNRETNFGLDAGSLGNRFTIGVYYTFKK
jgi:outer membrane protein W